MDLKFPQKSLLERAGFPYSKKVAFLAVAGVVVVVGIGLRVGHYLGGEEKAPVAVEAPEPTEGAPVTETAVPETPPAPPAAEEVATPAAPPEQATDAPEQPETEVSAVEPTEPADEASGQAGEAEGVDPSVILVSKRPVEVLASPSAEAPAMFGFPAGRPFRVIAREGGFIRIKDLRSGASGWIEEAALAPAKRAEPKAAPSASPSSGGGGTATTSSGSKPKPAKKDTEVTASESEDVQTRRRPGLFGKGGLFGGIFGGN